MVEGKRKRGQFRFQDEAETFAEQSGVARAHEGTAAFELAQEVRLDAAKAKRFNRGMADIRVFDQKQQLDGIAYVLKVVRDDRGNEIENPPVKSKALLKLIHQRKRDNFVN